MALILLILIGASFGWLSSVITRAEEPGAILRQMGIGVAASLVIGLLVNSGTILGGLTAWALIAAVAGSVLALVAYQLFANRSAQA